MRGLLLMVILGLTTVTIAGEETKPASPQIVGYGAVVPMPNAAEPPRRGIKIVFDITSDGKPEEVHKGLESVARYLNLNAQAGNKASDAQLALVLHGPATKAALNDAAYASRTEAKQNPNLALVRELKKHGVEVFVCGQALARHKYAAADVAPEFTTAVSAMTVNANKQQDGYSYIFVH